MFGSRWTSLQPNQKDLFLNKILKLISRINQKFAYEKKIFPAQAIAKNLFVLHSRYTWNTPYRLWFSLGQLYGLIKKT